MVRNNIAKYLSIPHSYDGINCLTLIHEFYKNMANNNYNKETFIAEFEKYFSKKGYNISRDIINEIYQIINN